MADFALWAMACETALWPAGTFARAYETNRRTGIESTIDADPVASGIRGIMTGRSSWTGSAADLLRACPDCNGISKESSGWPKNPRALSGRLRRAQTFLRVLGIDIAFSREGHAAWLAEFEHEVFVFPNGRYNDQVAALSQVLAHGKPSYELSDEFERRVSQVRQRSLVA